LLFVSERFDRFVESAPSGGLIEDLNFDELPLVVRTGLLSNNNREPYSIGSISLSYAKLRVSYQIHVASERPLYSGRVALMMCRYQ